MAFSLWPWVCNQLKPTTGQQITLEKHVTSMYTWHLGLQYSQMKLVRWYPFWQLSSDYNMDVHKDVHYQVKYMQIVYALDT